MSIATLTLNPAFDLHCTAETFREKHENFAAITSYEAGGKGINVSRALLSGGAENTAIALLGEENASEFEQILKKDGVALKAFYLPGRIRENVTVHTPEGETRLSFEGFRADVAALHRIREAILREWKSGDHLIVSGSLPKGIGVSEAVETLQEISAAGILISLDCRSFGLEEMKTVKPFLVKPNEEEIARCLQRDRVSREDMLAASRELLAAGVGNVMISLGAKGALLVCGEGEFSAAPPSCRAVSTIGAGDSTVAGFVAAASRGEKAAVCLQTAMAYGQSACKTEGTRPPRREDILSVFPHIPVENI